MFDLSKVEKEQNFEVMNPGVNIPSELENISIDKDQNLDFHFKGTSPENPGIFKPRFFANNFDTNNEKYNNENAKNQLQQIRKILEAYLPDEQVDKVKGASWGQFVQSLMQTLTPDKYKGVETYLKAIFRKDSDKFLDIPRFRDFISTKFRPKKLVLSDKKNDNGIPYERVKPLSEYGIEPDSNDENELPFSTTNEVSSSDEDMPAFGQSNE